MKLSHLLILIAVFNFSLFAHALKFFVYNPRFGRSHVIYMGGLADLLVKGGHDVVNYQPIHDTSFDETGVKLARTRIREPDHDLGFNLTEFGGNVWKGMSLFSMLRMNFTEVMRVSCEEQLNDEVLLEELRNEKFDFALTENMDKCPFLLLEKIGIKRFGIVHASTLPFMLTSALGIPSTEAYVPDGMTAAIPPFSFVERLKNVFGRHMMEFVFKPKFLNGFAELGYKHINKDFDILKKIQETSVVFVNVDEFLDFPRPISHKIHYIGGIGMKKPEPLSKKYEEIFARGERFIYMSFGTVAPSIMMPSEKKQAFLDAFARFPEITFLWKYERPEDKINSNHSNVICEKWWPQKDLLPHPKLLAFITHGGMNSVGEAAHAGVPLITVPLFADQHRNAKMAEFRRFAVALDNPTLTADSIAHAIKQIIENKSYKENAMETKNLIDSKPYNSEDVFLKYSAFASQFDLHSRLDLSGRKLNTIEFYNLDVFAFIFTATLIVLYISFLVSRKVIKKLWSCFQTKKSKRE